MPCCGKRPRTGCRSYCWARSCRPTCTASPPTKPCMIRTNWRPPACSLSRIYQPDYYVTPALIGSGKIYETLALKQYKWPGHGVSKESGYQYVEGNYMTADDYPALIDDPTDFWLRTWMPESLAPWNRYPTLSRFHGSLGNRPGFPPDDPLRYPAGARRLESADGSRERGHGLDREDDGF